MLATLLNVLFVCAAVPVLLVLPGAVLWRNVLRRYERLRRFAGETLGPWTSLAVQAAISMLITGWVGFLLGEIGIFSRTLLVGIVAGLGSAGMVATRLTPRELVGRHVDRAAPGLGSLGEQVRRAWGSGGVGAGLKGLINDLVLRNEWFYAPVLLVVVVLLCGSPMRTLWRGHEAGRHLACGIALAEHGSFRLDDPIGPTLWSDSEADHSSHVRLGGNTRLASGLRLGGEYRVGPHDRETIHPAFLHFGATWVGIGYALLGRWGAMHVSVLIAVVAVAMFLLFARTMTSVKVALLAAALLVLNFAQCYFVRTSSPAVIAQLLAVTAFVFFVWFVRLEVKPFGLLAGVALGQLVLTGEHLYPVLLVGWFVFACTTYKHYHPKKLYRFIVFPLLVFAFQPVLFDAFLGTYYTRNLARGLTEALVARGDGDWTVRLPAAMARLAGIIGLVAAGVAAYRAASRRNERFRAVVQRALSWRDGLAPTLAGAAIALAYLVVYAARHAPFLVEDGVVVHHGKWFYQFIDELGFGFFLLGIGLFVYFCAVRPRQPGLTFPFTVFFLFLATALWNPGTSGVLMHGAARLVPLYLPFACFFVAYSLFALREVSGRLVLGEAVKVLVVILALVLPAIAARDQQIVRPWDPQTRARDILAQYDRFFDEELFPRDAVVLFDPALVPSQVPLVMQLVYDVDCVVLDGEWADPHAAGRLAQQLVATGRPVFFAHAADATPTVPAGCIRGADMTLTIATSVLEEKVGSRPRSIVSAGSTITLVDLDLAAETAR